MVWRLNTNKEFTSSIDTDYPQFVARWLHIGEKITAALRWINGRNYFFSYKSYYRYDHINHQVKKNLESFVLNSFIFLLLKRSMIRIQHILVRYQNGGFNVIKEHHHHLINLVYIAGNVQLLYTNQQMLI
jgi:hypothetical protein